mmetsp:Transcript_12205/g.24324  ORF Transcript_12205/g.24324 Transcript_12205/m.24324 type:complete len:209 (-) Transcript_12205:549-1175(-)
MTAVRVSDAAPGCLFRRLPLCGDLPGGGGPCNVLRPHSPLALRRARSDEERKSGVGGGNRTLHRPCGSRRARTGSDDDGRNRGIRPHRTGHEGALPWLERCGHARAGPAKDGPGAPGALRRRARYGHARTGCAADGRRRRVHQQGRVATDALGRRERCGRVFAGSDDDGRKHGVHPEGTGAAALRRRDRCGCALTRFGNNGRHHCVRV